MSRVRQSSLAELTHLSKMAKIGEPTINLRHSLSHAEECEGEAW